MQCYQTRTPYMSGQVKESTIGYLHTLVTFRSRILYCIRELLENVLKPYCLWCIYERLKFIESKVKKYRLHRHFRKMESGFGNLFA